MLSQDRNAQGRAREKSASSVEKADGRWSDENIDSSKKKEALPVIPKRNLPEMPPIDYRETLTKLAFESLDKIRTRVDKQ